MSYTLIAPATNMNGRTLKILTVAAFANIPLTFNSSVSYGLENETCEYARNCNPLGRYPTLQTPEGYLFESNSIVRFLARNDKSNSNLYGRTPFEASQVDMWLDFAAGEIDAAALPYILLAFRGVQPAADALARVEETLTGLDNWLENRTYLVGERLTVADIVVAFGLQWLVRGVPTGEAVFKKFRNALRLYNTVMQQPKTVEVLKANGATFGFPPAEKKAEEKKAEKPAEKKEEKKKAAAADDDDEDEAPMEDKKKPNPLDALPPSPFVLDAFKREYSNTDTRSVAAPYFFKNFDAAGFSAFWCRYKYNEENKMQFMTANLVRGWFQRMEGCRKYAFGVALLIGEEKKHEIVALWVFRGKGMPECVNDVEDTVLFDWTEIADVNAEQAKITDYLCWEGPTIEKPVLEGKCFK
jgi:elongation factor 1-gamma